MIGMNLNYHTHGQQIKDLFISNSWLLVYFVLSQSRFVPMQFSCLRPICLLGASGTSVYVVLSTFRVIYLPNSR